MKKRKRKKADEKLNYIDMITAEAYISGVIDGLKINVFSMKDLK